MSLKESFVRIRDNYVINQVQRVKLPEFEPDVIRKYRITFSGRVQNVGFRLEVTELMKRLELTGFCKNLENGDVLAELQGPNNKIQYLVSFMESLIRIKITDKVVEELLKETNELIGTALIYYEEEVNCWEIGYNLGKKYWGKGYTTEAMKKVIEFATVQLGLSEIVGRYAKENPASGNVMKKLGFQYEKDIPYECNDGEVMREGVQCRLVM